MLLEQAQLEWDDQGQPRSSAFGDVYFSRHNGLEETRYVFLRGNRLAERFAAASGNFVIAETGFGSGLNFLATWALWRQTAPADATLHFISLERFPLSTGDLSRALALWPELKEMATQLQQAYPHLPARGFHRLDFARDRVHLTLLFDDVIPALRQLKSSDHPEFNTANFSAVDAWFLDGFAPSRNPDMWAGEVIELIADLSVNGATVSTFSAAGHVRRALQQQGFVVSKSPGFHGKREMVEAVFHAESRPEQKDNDGKRKATRQLSPHAAPWYVIGGQSGTRVQSALVIGAGVAGCHTARALAERGLKVHILEKEAKVAERGSGNRQGALYSKLSVDDDLFAQFNLHALLYAHRIYAEYRTQSGDIDGASGILHLAYDEREASLHQRLSEQFDGHADFIRFVNQREATELAGMELPFPGYFIPRGGWLSPPRLCAWLIDHPNISLQTGAEVSQLVHDGDEWHAYDGEGSVLASAEAAVIANAADAMRFEQSALLPLKSIRGQVSLLQGDQCLNELRTVVTAAGYVTPAWQGKQCFGATFDHRDHSQAIRQQDHLANLDKLLQAIPQAGPQLDTIDINSLEGRTGFRCATPDYLPAVGFIAVRDRFLENYQRLRKDANADIPLAGEYLPNLLVNVGHGSRGVAYTPLCGELIAALLTASPLPVSRSLAAALNPARFLIRDIIRGKA